MEFVDDFDRERNENYIKKKRDKIDIPDFLSSSSDVVPMGEEETVVLNNVPGNSSIEEIRHLNGSEKVAMNLTDDEWVRFLYYAPSKLMTDEVQRRLSGYEEETNAFVDIVDVVKKLKLIKMK